MLLVAACSTPEKTPPIAPVQRVVQSPGRVAVSLTETDAGASVVLETGQALVVRLPTVATANLEWSVVDLKPGVLTVLGSVFERSLRNSGSGDESEGTTIWRFKAEAAGSAALRFELRRPRSVQPAVQTLSYSVSVK